MAKRGRPPNRSRREEAARLRAQGLTLAQIGARMNSSKQGAAYLLRRADGGADRCRACDAVLTDKPLHLRVTVPTYCLDCLARHPKATFGERLRAFRVAAGLRVKDLAERAGLSISSIVEYEQGRRDPSWRPLGKLVAVLGPGLVVVGDVGRG